MHAGLDWLAGWLAAGQPRSPETKPKIQLITDRHIVLLPNPSLPRTDLEVSGPFSSLLHYVSLSPSF